MTTANAYLASVSEIQDDIETALTVSAGADLALSGTESFLNLPGQLANRLSGPVNALDLPGPIVTALGFVPFGIGTAITTLDRIAGESVDVINAQIDAMRALDVAWASQRAFINTAQQLQSTADTALSGFETTNNIRLGEAEVLAASLGDQDIFAQSELHARLTAYTAKADVWFDARATTLSPLETAVANLQNALAVAEAFRPDFSSFAGITDAIENVFGPLADAARDLEDAICIEINLGIFTVDVCEVLEFGGTFLSAVLGFVEGFILDAIALTGFDIRDELDGLKKKILAPLDPIFDAIDDVQDEIGDAVSDGVALASQLSTQLNDIVDLLRDAVDQGALFDNTVIGDEAPGLVAFADTLLGTGGEDGIYGLLGDDTLIGGAGDDFIFGGDGNDLMLGGDGNDGLYGGDGDDVGLGSGGDNLLDGGAGFDILLGNAGEDLVMGGAGFDILIGGDGADTFVLREGAQLEYVSGFENDIDQIAIDASLLNPGEDVTDIVLNYASLRRGNVVLNFGEETLIVTGLTSQFSLLDDLIIV